MKTYFYRPTTLLLHILVQISFRGTFDAKNLIIIFESAMSAASTIPPGAGGGDEEAWLYESKETDVLPPGDDSSQEPVST